MGDHQRAGKQSAYDTEMVYPPVDDLPSSQLHVANMPKWDPYGSYMGTHVGPIWVAHVGPT